MSLLHRNHKPKHEPPVRCQYQALVVDERADGFWALPELDARSEPDEGYRQYLADFGDWLVGQSPRLASLHLVLLEGRENPRGSGNFDMDRQIFTRDLPLDAAGALDKQRFADWCFSLQRALIKLQRSEQSLGWFVHVETLGAEVLIAALHRTLEVGGDDANLRIALREELSDERRFATGDEQQELDSIQYRVEVEDKVQRQRDAEEQQNLKDLEGVVERQVSEEDAADAEQLGAGSAQRVLDGADPSLLG